MKSLFMYWDLQCHRLAFFIKSIQVVHSDIHLDLNYSPKDFMDTPWSGTLVQYPSSERRHCVIASIALVIAMSIPFSLTKKVYIDENCVWEWISKIEIDVEIMNKRWNVTIAQSSSSNGNIETAIDKCQSTIEHFIYLSLCLSTIYNKLH